MPVEGIVDLSHWQAPVDFVAFKNGGGLAVILKATQGSTWVDSTFTKRLMQATAAGLLVSAYHFADASSPDTQASHFLSVAGGVGALAIDIEPNGMGDTVSIPQAAEIVARVHVATARLPWVYMGRYGPDGRGSGLPNSILSRCPLWLPEYGTQPRPPAGWLNWTLWQWTDQGAIAGISGPCDRSRFAGTEEQLRTFWSS